MGARALAFGIHLVLADGHGQLEGQSRHVAKEVASIFGAMGIEVTWSSDPSDPPCSCPNKVLVTVLPHSSLDWRIGEGAMAAVLLVEPETGGSVFLFYPDVVRTMDYRLGRTSSIRDGRPGGALWQVGVARVIAHEILHYFLPGRPHDRMGIFMEHLRGDALLSPALQVSHETREALLSKLTPSAGRELREASPLAGRERARR